MRILQINAVNGIRSTGRTVTELADYLSERGHETYIAYSHGLQYEREYKIGSRIDKKAHGICSRILGKQAYFSKHSTIKLLKWIEKISPDIVHLGNLHGNFINLNLLLNYLTEKDIPTVITLHDCWFYTGKCSHYTIDGCNKWKSQCGSCPRLKKDNKSWFFDHTTDMLLDKKVWFSNIPRLAVVGVSDWITNESKQSILSTAKIITRIHNWINIEQFKPVNSKSFRIAHGIENKFVILGIASRWSKSKGLDKFLELERQLKNDEVIILVGKMPQGTDLPKNIIHVQETHNIDELVQFYSTADVFINFSMEESFGKVVAEALACGTPVITNDSTANPELVDRTCGFVYKSFSEIILIVEEIKAKGKDYYLNSCVEHARDKFNSFDRMNDYFQLYTRLIESDMTL